MNKEEICDVLGIQTKEFTKWVNNSVIVKRPDNDYEVHAVVREILSNKDSRIRDLMNGSRALSKRLNNAHDKIARIQAGGDESPEARKKEVDIDLKKRQIRKMDMDELIRKKDFVPAEMLNEVVGSLARIVADDLTQIPMKLKRLIPDMKSSTFEEVKLFLSKTRNAMADYDTGPSVQQHINRYSPKKYFDRALDSKSTDTDETERMG